MVIVSQDKYNILNFDTTVNVGVEEISILNDIVQISAETNGNTIILGRYKNECRAKEIIDEIITVRAIFELYKYSDANIQDIFDKKMLEEKLVFDTYEMPKE